MEVRARVRLLVVFLTLSAPSSTLIAADHKPWPRRPGVILYRLKQNAAGFENTALSRVMAASRPSSVMAEGEIKSYQSAVFTAGREEEMAEAMRASGAVDFAEPDYLMQAASAVPDDPQYSSQWYHQTINSPGAWSYTTGTNSILVAICDTGVDATHPDLAANMSLPGYNVVDHSTNTDPIAPHGTEVAGVIGAVGNNNVGVAGMDWTIKILPVRITNNPDTSAWCSDMASGIEWAADHGAKVINLSYETGGCPNTIEAASQYAQARGALVFVAAGNSGMDLSGQYAIPHSFLLVGATDISDHQTIFSNFGAPVILGAPGSNMLTTQPGGYGTASGTSFSAPVAAGVAALVFSLNPAWSPTTVENILLATAKSIGSNMLGYGRVDAGAALAAAQNCLTGNCISPSPLGSTPPTTPNQPPASAAASVPNVRVYPNPWKANAHPNAFMTFDHLASAGEVKIYTISGREVKRLAANTTVPWDLTNDSGERVASGVYLYLATDSAGQEAKGKLAVIR